MEGNRLEEERVLVEEIVLLIEVVRGGRLEKVAVKDEVLLL